jgi:hypothetical protein
MKSYIWFMPALLLIACGDKQKEDTAVPVVEEAAE